MPDNKDEHINDRKVRRLVERQKSGRAVPLGTALKLCPYRTLLALPGTPLSPATRPTCVVACLGFVPEDFSDRMRADILRALRQGEIVGLVANRAELRDYAKREIMLALAQPFPFAEH
jgi:hypothetical protein